MFEIEWCVTAIARTWLQPRILGGCRLNRNHVKLGGTDSHKQISRCISVISNLVKSPNQPESRSVLPYLSNQLKRLLLLAIAALAVVLFSGLFRAVGSEPNQPALQWTSVVMSPLTPQAEPVLGVDGKYHAVYELEVMNTSPVIATLKQVMVLDGRDQDRVLATYEGSGLLTRLRTLNNREASTPAIELNGTRLVLVDVAFDSREAIPPRLLHRI